MTAFVAPSTYQVGQQYEFGAGAFRWGALPNGQMGWKAPDGRQWDATGNPYTQMAQGTQQAYQTTATGGQAGPVTDPAGGLLTQQSQAQNILRGLPDPQKVNVANFLRLPKSAQELSLAGFEAKGYDKGDVLEQFGKMLPKATGPRRGYVAPLAG